MSRAVPALAISAGLVAACGEDTHDAGAQLLLPGDVELHWDESFNGARDGLGALVPIDVMVYEGATGAPLDGVEVFLQADYDFTEVVSANGFRVVDAEECAACPVLWDAEHDAYILLDEPAEPGIQLHTDADGLSRVYVYVDAFPASGEDGFDFEPISVLVSMGITDESFALIPR